ncbi:unnamed protein product [Ostreobium quekettii]|uniref:60S ribosomal protein L7a n=2 Tax=Ostreobium quekettii TaxID=121088 RepID=A0A8S1J6X3_9CHLO|nr:unnamed protein product [Ostreobium quekettii]|eukprot:evm.model.scf_42.4 EVM.evm.TU.scf_42.4   scf_42:24880-27177(+)
MVTKKKVAPVPAAVAKKTGGVAKKKKADPYENLYESRSKAVGPGNYPPPKRDMHRWVRWPKYVRVQRQRRILCMRLKVPPAINQFTHCLDRNQASTLFKLLMKYRPEDRKTKQIRLQQEAELREKQMEIEKKKPIVVKFGLKHVTALVENVKAQLVIIAHDVDPLELVIWLPALCKKMGVPYCIVKGKARLGSVVHQKTAACLAITNVKNEDQREFSKIVETCKAMFNEGPRISWGGGVLGMKSQHKLRKREKILQKELAQRMQA